MTSLMNEVYNEFLYSRKVKYDLDNWWFMSTPLYLAVILSTYLIFVLYLGPKLMKNREPFKLNTIMVIYNAIQVMLVTYLFLQPFFLKDGIKVLTQPCLDYSEKYHVIQTERIGWWTFIAKLLDLLDTVFFVLRKKQSHVTFLHVYHHSIMVFSTFISIKYIPAHQFAFPMWMNCFVHMLMYSYYLIAALGPSYKKYLWWKKYMTKVQLVQFVIGLIYIMGLYRAKCNLPKFLTMFGVMNGVAFLTLFINFYYQTYTKKEAKNKNL